MSREDVQWHTELVLWTMEHVLLTIDRSPFYILGGQGSPEQGSCEQGFWRTGSGEQGSGEQGVGEQGSAEQGSYEQRSGEQGFQRTGLG